MNIIFVVGDGLRVKNLSCYESSKETTPTIDQMAEEGVLFKNAFSCTDHTDPSFTTMLSGKYPLSHGITRHGTRSHGITEEQLNIFNKTTMLLPEILKTRDYYTMAFDWLGRWHRKGYDFYGENDGFSFSVGLEKTLSYLPDAWGRYIKRKIHRAGYSLPGRSGKHYMDLATDFVRRKKDEDFFMLFHGWDTHTPFNTLPSSYFHKFYKEDDGETVDEMLKRIKNETWREIVKNYHLSGIEYVDEIPAVYDGAANYFDHLVKQLLDCLEDNGILGETLIVLTGDHGDNVMRDGKFVGHFGLYDDVIHVPLILYGSDLSNGKEIESFVQHVDLVPTFMELLDLEFADKSLDGKSLLPLIRDEERSLRSSVFAQAAAARETYAIRTEDYKYIWSSTPDPCLHDFDPVDGQYQVELYDLNEDLEETENIVQNNPDLEEVMRSKLLSKVEELKNKRDKQLKKNETDRIKEKVSGLKKGGKRGF